MQNTGTIYTADKIGKRAKPCPTPMLTLKN